MLSTGVESCWAGMKTNREVDDLACCPVYCACSRAFAEIGSQSLLEYLKTDKGDTVIVVCREPVP